MKTRAVIFSIVVVLAVSFFIWDKFFAYDPGDVERRYIEAMTADTYGGATPQETLDLFVAALRAADVELASKYFMLDDNLSRDKWVKTLNEIKNNNLLDEMADDFLSINFYKQLDDDKQQFIVYNDDKTDSIIINMQFNKYTEVWKIENL